MKRHHWNIRRDKSRLYNDSFVGLFFQMVLKTRARIFISIPPLLFAIPPLPAPNSPNPSPQKLAKSESQTR